MAINSEFDYRENILFVKSSGFDEGLDDVISYNNLVHNAAIKNNCNKIICDERKLEYRLSITDTFKLGVYVSNNINSDFNIAIITEVKDKEIVEFWENVTVNRGCSIKVFYDENTAYEWIKKI